MKRVCARNRTVNERLIASPMEHFPPKVPRCDITVQLISGDEVFSRGRILASLVDFLLLFLERVAKTACVDSRNETGLAHINFVIRN